MCICTPDTPGMYCGNCQPEYSGPRFSTVAEREEYEREQKSKTLKRKKGIYIGAPACFALEEALRHVCEAFNVYGREQPCGCYIVGSCLQRADWRDVDVRLILHDDVFAEIFPNAGQNWEHDARWLLLTVAISERLSKLTGLPVDFQFQPMTHANKVHGRAQEKPRSAAGLRVAREIPAA